MSVTETELKERAVAPRVTLAQVNEVIASEHYFTAEDGATNAPPEEAGRGEFPELAVLTFCVLVLKNGFTVTGQSACADPANYKADIGQRIARQDAINKIWPLLGYELKTKLSEESKTWQERLEKEFSQLGEKLKKLNQFVGTEAYALLPYPDRMLLSDQLNAMSHYYNILGARLTRARGA